MAAVVFLFGGVGPDDLVRAYVLLVCFAVGFGAVGLFISALVKRTQVATVLTYLTILALTAGTWVVWYFLYATSGVSAPGGFIPGTGAASGRPAQQMLWLNPFVADMDLVCVTSVTGYSDACLVMSAVTGKPYFGGSFGSGECAPGVPCSKPMPMPMPAVEGFGGVNAADGVVIAGFAADGACPPNARCVAPRRSAPRRSPRRPDRDRLPAGHLLAAVGGGLHPYGRRPDAPLGEAASCPPVEVPVSPGPDRTPTPAP